MAYPHWPTILWGLPLSGKPLPPQIMLAYNEITSPMNTNMVKMHCVGQQIADARNNFAKQALNMGAKYLFFLDEDVAPPPFALRELCFQLEHHPDWGVIGGIYALKCERPEPLVFKGRGTGPYWDWKVGEIFEVSGIGMGCTMLRVDMFKDLDEPWFRTVQDLDDQLDNIARGAVWTEDLWFCHQVVSQTKWKIVAHGQIVCPHYDLSTGRAYELPPESKPMRHLLLGRGKKKIVDLGCGPNKYSTSEGRVIGVDIREFPGVDYRCDLRKLPFATGEFDVVYSCHALEHFPKEEVPSVLREWTRILKPNGELRLVLPNLKLAARQILEDKFAPYTMNILYGAHEYPQDFHNAGFTDYIISKELKSLGFKHVSVTEQNISIVVQAMRRRPRKEGKCQRSKSNRKNSSGRTAKSTT